MFFLNNTQCWGPNTAPGGHRDILSCRVDAEGEALPPKGRAGNGTAPWGLVLARRVYSYIQRVYKSLNSQKYIYIFFHLNFLLFSSFSSLFPLLLTFFPPLLKSFPICLEIPPGPGGIRNNMQPWNILIYNGAPGTAGCQR